MSRSFFTILILTLSCSQSSLAMEAVISVNCSKGTARFDLSADTALDAAEFFYQSHPQNSPVKISIARSPSNEWLADVGVSSFSNIHRISGRRTTNTGFMIFSVDLLRESDGLVSPLVAGYQIVNDAIPEATNRETIDLRGFSCAIQL